MAFSPEYVRLVLNENFEDAKAQFLSPLMAINYAHLVMLAEQSIVTREDAHAIREALDGISLADVSARHLRRHVRGPVLLRRAARDREAAARRPQVASTPRGRATIST